MATGQNVDNPFHKLRILLVEDEPFVQKLTLKVLRGIGVGTIELAENGKDALQILSRSNRLPIHLVISDWNMPGITGLELLRYVREFWPEMPFIMLTGNITGDSVMAAKELRVDGYIAKPIRPIQLRSKIAAVLKIKLP